MVRLNFSDYFSWTWNLSLHSHNLDVKSGSQREKIASGTRRKESVDNDERLNNRRAFIESQNTKCSISISYIKELVIMSIQVESWSRASAAAINWVCHSALFPPQSETDCSLVTGASFLNGNNFLKKCRLALMSHNGANNETSLPESAVAERPRRSGFWNGLSWVLAPVMWSCVTLCSGALNVSLSPPAGLLLLTCASLLCTFLWMYIFLNWLHTMFWT